MPEPNIRPRKPGASVPNVTRSMYSYASHHSVPNPMTRSWNTASAGAGGSRIPSNVAVGGSPTRNPGRSTAHFDATRSRDVSRRPPLPILHHNSSSHLHTQTPNECTAVLLRQECSVWAQFLGAGVSQFLSRPVPQNLQMIAFPRSTL